MFLAVIRFHQLELFSCQALWGFVILSVPPELSYGCKLT